MEPQQKVKKINIESVPVARTSQSNFPGESMDSKSVDILDKCKTVSPDTKEEITGAMYYCMELLEKMDIINKTRSTVRSNRSKIIGEKMAKEFINLIHSHEFVEETKLLAVKEECESHSEIVPINIEYAIEESSSSPEKSEDESQKDSVPFELKLKAVRLSELHPKWSIKTLASRSTRKLTSKVQLWRWKKYVKNGGTKFEKYRMIDEWVFDRFQEARKNGHPVTTETLHQWAMTAAAPLLSKNFQFQASRTWCDTFKARHRI